MSTVAEETTSTATAKTPAGAVTATVTTPGQSSLMELFQKSAVVGSGLVGSGTIIWGIIELLRSEPDKGFKLLMAWGPWVFVVVLVVAVLNGWVKNMQRAAEKRDDRMGVVLDRIIGTQERLASAAEENAAAAKAQAAAQQQAADKDDRQMQELQTLTAYTSQESERNSTALRHIAEVQAENAEAIKKILQAIESRPQIDINQVVAQAVTEYKRTESPPAPGVTR